MLANSKPQGNHAIVHTDRYPMHHHHHPHPHSHPYAQYHQSLPSPPQQQQYHPPSKQRQQHLGSREDPQLHKQQHHPFASSASSAKTSPRYSFDRSESKQEQDHQSRHQLASNEPCAPPPLSHTNQSRERKHLSPSPNRKDEENPSPSKHARPPSSRYPPSVASMVTSLSSSSVSSLSTHHLPLSRSPVPTNTQESMDVDETEEALGDTDRLELLSSESSTMDQCEPQRGWSSASSQHTNSPSPIMANANCIGTTGPCTRKRLSIDSHRDQHSHFYEKEKEEQDRRKHDGGRRGQGGANSPPFARSQSEYRFHRSREEQECASEGQPRKQQRMSMDPFRLGAKGIRSKILATTSSSPSPPCSLSLTGSEHAPSGTGTTTATTSTTPTPPLSSYRINVPIETNYTIQRERKHHSSLVAPPPLPSLLPSRRSPQATQPSPLPSPTAAMDTATMETTTYWQHRMSTPTPFHGTTLLKSRQSSPTLTLRRPPSLGYLSEAQKTLYERHPPSPSPPPSAAVTLDSTTRKATTQQGCSQPPPPLLTLKQERDENETNYVFGCAQTVTRQHPQPQQQRRLPPISKDGYLQGHDARIDLDDDDDDDYDYHHRHRRPRLLPPIVGPASSCLSLKDRGLPTETLYSASTSLAFSGALSHSFSATSSESSISPTHPPSVYPPPAPPTRSSSYHEYGSQQLQHCRGSEDQWYYPQPTSTQHHIKQQYQQQKEYSKRSSSWNQHYYPHQPPPPPHPSLSSKTQRSNSCFPPRHSSPPTQSDHQHIPSSNYASISHNSHNHHHNNHNNEPPSSSSSSSSSLSSSSSALQIVKNESDGSIMVYNPQTESMTFKCELCPFESFGRIHDLKRHQTSKHKDMTWPCDFCHRPFVRRDALLRHYTVKAARADGLHPASHEVEKLLEARARAKMLY